MKTIIKIGFVFLVIIAGSIQLYSQDQSETIQIKSLGLSMALIKQGSFIMGNVLYGRNDDEKKEHTVIVDSFYISVTEITQEQWSRVMGTSVSQLRDRGKSNWPIKGEGDDFPIYYVSWYDAIEFCNKLSVIDNLQPVYTILNNKVTWDHQSNGYRLPTEAEWEYTAKGGPVQQGQEKRYAGGDDLDTLGWYYKNSSSMNNEVGKKKQNNIGIFDMSGNVWEWCWDIYGAYSGEQQKNPFGADTGDKRVTRGGHWYGEPDGIPVFARNNESPDMIGLTSGFRIVKPAM